MCVCVCVLVFTGSLFMHHFVAVAVIGRWLGVYIFIFECDKSRVYVIICFRCLFLGEFMPLLDRWQWGCRQETRWGGTSMQQRSPPESNRWHRGHMVWAPTIRPCGRPAVGVSYVKTQLTHYVEILFIKVLGCALL